MCWKTLLRLASACMIMVIGSVLFIYTFSAHLSDALLRAETDIKTTNRL